MPEKINNSENHTCRLGKDFFIELEKIQKTRIDLNKSKPSIRLLSNLIVKHVRWNEIKKDLISIDLKEERL